MSDDHTGSNDDPGGDVSELFGAYALDALDDEERARVEARLAVDPDARDEVDRLAGAVDTMFAADAEEMAPPEDLWDRIAADLPGKSRERLTDDATSDELSRRRARRAPSRVGVAILGAAAAVIVIAIGAALVARSGDDAPSLAAQLQSEADEVAAAPDSRTVELTSADTAASVTVVVGADGRAFVTPHGLADLDEALTYQLWSMDAEPVSLGLLGPDPTVTVMTIGGDPELLGISVEPASGSAAPTADPVVTGSLA